MLFPFGMESASLNHPTMSVCIPTRNRMEMLREAIESVLVQTFDDFELIISDNASTDRTEDVVGAFHDGRIRYVKLERDVGAIGNFNHCLGMARGRYVCILNDDDWMLPENLLQKARALDRHAGVGFVYSHYHLVDDRRRRIMFHPNFRQPERHSAIERGHDFVERSLLSGFALIMSSVVLRRECVETVGRFHEHLLYTADYEYWMRIALRYDVMLLAVPLVQYRLHRASETTRYTTFRDGHFMPSPRGQEELFKAKLSIVKAAKGVMPEWKSLAAAVRRYAGGQLACVVEREFVEERRRGRGFVFIAAMWVRYWRILSCGTVLRTLLISCAGKDGVRRLRRLKGHAASLKRSRREAAVLLSRGMQVRTPTDVT